MRSEGFIELYDILKNWEWLQSIIGRFFMCSKNMFFIQICFPAVLIFPIIGMEQKSLPALLPSEPALIQRLQAGNPAFAEERVRGIVDNEAIKELCSAVKKNRGVIVEKILEINPDLVNNGDEDGRKPIFYALDVGREMVELLLRKGAHLGEVSRQWKTLLHHAIEKEKDDIAEFIISVCGSDQSVRWILEASDEEGNAPLHQAIRAGKSSLVGSLLQQGCSTGVRDVMFNTPLHVAAQEGRTEIVTILLAVGANVEVYNALGATPLHCAAARGHSAICSALIRRPDIIAKLLVADNCCKRIITALCCIDSLMKQLVYGKMPREILFKIFSSDKDLLKDFTIMLLLGSYNLKKREPITFLTNTSAWRLLIHYNKERRIGEIIVAPGEKVVLDVRPDEISLLTATTHGAVWGKLQRTPLDLCKELQAEVARKPGHDVEMVIDGGQGRFNQFTRPFRERCLSYNVAEYQPVSLVPKSRLLLDAFPCVKHKVANNELIEARHYLQLSDCSREAVDIAYARLNYAWDNERKLISGNGPYIDRVQEILTAAYDYLMHKKPFSEFQRNETVPMVEMFEPQDSRGWLILRFFNRQLLTPDVIKKFFTKLCVEEQQEYVMMCDIEGRSAYEIALENHHGKLVQLLHADHIVKNFGEQLKQQLETCLCLKLRDPIEHEPDASLTSLILKSLHLQNHVDNGLKTVESLTSKTGAVAFNIGKTVLTTGVAVIGAPLKISDALYYLYLRHLAE